jgi:lipoyl-dependent peroxiredoxin
MPIRTASARWQGNLTEGSGTIRTGKGGLEGNYSFKSRFEEGEGTNPEELIAAAHAACFSMALSNGLAKAGTPPEHLDVQATATFVPGQGITGMVLVLSGSVPGLSDEEFAAAAQTAKENCPVSKALANNVPITLEMR